MADYVPPGVVEKRVRYFDGQFLQDQDFIDEQNYQLDREHRHNRLLHGPGIADGLTVTSTAPNQVTVAPGTAIDSDGHQLALADATTVDLPAGDFNDKQGVQLYLSYAESAEDPQAVGGSQDFTRWLERPELTAVAPGHDYAGASPPVLLASLALDNGGRVAVDGTVRSYAGVRLPGADADAVTLRATSGGPVDLAGSLTVENRVGIGTPSPAFPLHLGVGKALRIEGGSSSSDSAPYFSFGGNGAFGIDAPGVVGGRFTVQNTGHVGIGTASPGNDLEVGAFQAQDRFLAFKVQGGNAYRSGIKLFTWKDNNGFSIQYDERNQTGNGLHVKTHNQDADGTTQLFVGWSGNVGVGTTTPAARFSVVAPGTTEIAGSAHSTVLRTTAGALGQTAGSEVALSSTGFSAAGNKVALGVRAIRTAAGTDWYSTAIGLGMDVDNTVRAGSSLFLHANHNVGIGTSTPGNDLEIGAFDDLDRFLAFKVQGGNKHRSGIKMWAWQDNNGFSVQYDERNETGNGLHIKTHNQNADGTTQLFVGWSGNIGIGTTTPAARFSVVAPGTTEIAGGAHSTVLRTTAGALAQTAGSEIALSSTGFSTGNKVALGVRAIRTAAGTDWYSTAIGLGMDVDNTVRAGSSLFLHANHNVGIGTSTPGNDLEIGAFDNQDRFLAFKVQGGNAHRSGIKMWTFKDNYGYSIQYDERLQTGNGLHIKTHNQNADGVTQLFVGWDGNIGIGTTNPAGQKLNVVGSTYLQGDLFVGGRMIYTSGGNSWWQLYPRQSGLDPTWWTANNGVGGPSDIRLKTDLRPISHALDLVRKLQGVRYQWGDEGLARFTRDIEDTVLAGPDATDEQNHERQQAERRRILQSLSGDRMGMVAQDVEAIAPELVYADEDGYKHIRYQHVTALLAEAIKEQDAVVQALSAEVAALQAKQ
jgi:endosialidase-like protein